jgi:hypothetical protein
MIFELAIGTVVAFGALLGVITILPWRSSYKPRVLRVTVSRIADRRLDIGPALRRGDRVVRR